MSQNLAPVLMSTTQGALEPTAEGADFLLHLMDSSGVTWGIPEFPASSLPLLAIVIVSVHIFLTRRKVSFSVD